MKFPYKRFRIDPTPALPHRKFLFRPLIPIRLSYNNKSIGYEALLDSGADFCIFDAEIGEYLQIPVVEGKPEVFGGIVGNTTTAYFHNVDICIQQFSFLIPAS